MFSPPGTLGRGKQEGRPRAFNAVGFCPPGPPESRDEMQHRQVHFKGSCVLSGVTGVSSGTKD